MQTKPTLYDINLEIFEGEKVLILGASGSGKSTLVNCINGLIPFSYAGKISGKLTVQGMKTQDESIFKLSKAVGTVLQDSDAQFVSLSVGEDIAFSMENENVPRPKMVPTVNKHAAVVGMQDFLGAVPFDLSGGQKQKVAIAGVLGNDVNILIFDEPLASLDPQMGMTAVDLIDQLSKNEGHTILIIEHRLEDVLYRPVDRIVLMAEGRIVADTTPDELLRSALLAEYGIREPLHITAMKYAGCDLNDKNLNDVRNIEFSSANEKKLKKFFAGEVKSAPRQYGEPVVELKNVDYAYTDKNVLNDVSFCIRRGERVAVIGKNGAGKSTAAKVICGVARPKNGGVFVDGADAAKMSIKEIGEKVGYVMQNPNQMLVKDIIKDETRLALDIRKLPEETVKQRLKDALTTCSLWTMRNWPVDAISYGQKKRVTVASIMALEPDVIILDEPTAGQDYRNYTEIMGFINRLNSEYGKTIIFITHDMHLALENTERAIVFSDSRVIADDTVFSVLSNDDVISRASLKQTSLYVLAVRLGLPPQDCIRHFIEYERMVQEHE